MNKEGPIIIIEDDSDDQYIISEILKSLHYTNAVLFFSDSEKALTFLDRTDEDPFLILSDIEMFKANGFELRRKIQTNVRLNAKCIPYLFFTSAANKENLMHAYGQSVQGFFTKPADFGELRSVLKLIIEYWKKCETPPELEC